MDQDQKNELPKDLPKIEIEELSEEDKKFLAEKNLPACADWVYTKPCRTIVPRTYKPLAESIRQFEFRPKDVVLMAFPKTGTTWLSEILWSMSCIDQLHRAETEGIEDRIIFLHNDMLRPLKEDSERAAAKKYRSKFPGKPFEDGVWLNLGKVAPDRRIIRCHLLPPLLHPSLLQKAKIVYITRNPKDTCVSSYHFRKDNTFVPFSGSFEDYCDLFMAKLLPFGGYFTNVKHMWALKGHPNVHHVSYEGLKKNLMMELKKLNEFAEFGLSEDQLKKVIEHTDIQRMRSREKKLPYIRTIEHTFFREGKVGGWKSLATPELDRRMDKWIEEECKDTEIEFTYQ